MAQITVTFNQAVPAPSLGYRIRYRVLNTPTWNTVTPNPTASPVNITVPDGYNWEVGVAAICSVKSASPEQYFIVNGAAPATSYPNSGYGNTVAASCSDSVNNNRIFYSSTAAVDFGIGTQLFLDAALTTPITGYTNVFSNGANWDINNQGQVIAYSSVQC